MLRRRLKRGIRVWDQAEQIWLILIAVAMLEKQTGKKTITYGDLAERLGYDRKAGITLARALDLIGRMCLKSGCPPLNVIVVAQHGAPGAEVILRSGSTVEADQRDVLKEDWITWRAPSAGSFRMLYQEINQK